MHIVFQRLGDAAGAALAERFGGKRGRHHDLGTTKWRACPSLWHSRGHFITRERRVGANTSRACKMGLLQFGGQVVLLPRELQAV